MQAGQAAEEQDLDSRLIMRLSSLIRVRSVIRLIISRIRVIRMMRLLKSY